MSNSFLCHYSEIGLKGKNQYFFERVLIRNIRQALMRALPDHKFRVERQSKRLLVHFREHVPDSAVLKALGKVCGVINFAPIKIVPSEIDQIEKAALPMLDNADFESFAVNTKRADKNFKIQSPDVNARIGRRIVETYDKQVDLKNPDLTLHIEILKSQTLLYSDKLPGISGLPVGTAGRALAMLSGGFDSPVAAFQIMRRGAHCDFIHFHSFPFTSKQSTDKVVALVKALNQFQYKARLYLIPFAETQKAILFQSQQAYRLIMYRRFMMRIAEMVARGNRMKALVTGDSLGQVASQTLDNMGITERGVNLPVLRPLIGMDKNDIIAIARNINTYDISEQPHDDACTRFMPKNPVIYGKLKPVYEAEQQLDVEGLLRRDIENMEILEITDSRG